MSEKGRERQRQRERENIYFKGITPWLINNNPHVY